MERKTTTLTTPATAAHQRRARASPAPLRTLPKSELHLHLEGSMRRSTLIELCGRHSLPVPPDTRNRRFSDFAAFVEVYAAACSCLRDERDVRRLVREVAEDAARSGALWIEPHLSLTLYADRFGGTRRTLRLLCRAAEEAETATGVGIGYVVSAERHLGPEEGMRLAAEVRDAAAAAASGDGMTIHGRLGIVGFGLHGPEVGYPPGPFEESFGIACGGSGGDTGAGCVRSIPHAGEMAPRPGDGAKSVADACSCLRANRIAHGVLAAYPAPDDAVLERLVESQTCLDVCVTSNYLLNVVPSIGQHPLPTLLGWGVPCTINSDDPLLFGCTLLGEYEICRDELGLDDEALAGCAKASFEHSCASEEVKRRGVEGIEKWLEVARGSAALQP